MKSILTCALALVLGTGVAFGISGCKNEKKAGETGTTSTATTTETKKEETKAPETTPPAEEKK